MNDVLGTAFDRIRSTLDTFTPSLTTWLAFPILVLGLFLALRISKHLLAFAARTIVIPAVQALVVVSHTLVLTLEFLGTQLWRLFSRPPPRPVYVLTDAVAAGKPVAVQGLRRFGEYIRQQARRRRSRAWLLVIVAILGWWNTVYCRGSSTVDCRPPPSAWAHSVNGVVRDLFRTTSGSTESAVRPSLVTSAETQAAEPMVCSLARLRR